MSGLSAQDLSALTVREIWHALKGNMIVPRTVQQRRASLVNFVIQKANATVQGVIRDVIQSKEALRQHQIEARASSQKRKRIDDQRDRRTRRRLEEVSNESRDTSQFLQLPSDAQWLNCYRQFYEATSNAAVLSHVCGVCARECSVGANDVTIVSIQDVPQRNRLVPQSNHPEHNLFQGLLLEPAGVLPNGRGEPTNVHSLQHGLRGNVTTYDLDQAGVASMLQGRLMPRPLSLLPSVITITFIGRNQLSRHGLKAIFRNNHPKYYGDIEIDPDRLLLLPNDDIPDELLGVVRQATDTGIVDQESAGYVPPDGDSVPVSTVRSRAISLTKESSIAPTQADVIPLQFSGTVDTDLTRLTANEMMIWGLANLWNQGHEGAYHVRPGTQPVSDFGHPRSAANLDPAPGGDSDQTNFFEKAFPCLFPYGCGGIEGNQHVRVPFREHIQWALQYHDRRFRKHETFPFVSFGILQRREALGSARIQMRRKNFEHDARIMCSITLEQLQQARAEEESGIPISNPAVRLMRSHVNATVSRVMASDQSRIRMRSQIWSTALYLGPPYVWITINPCDLHDPLTQVFAGVNIDLDKFCATMGPDKDTRAKNVASDPYASAKYFHFMIRVILETLFQVKTSKFKIESRMGLLGQVTAYFGTVEAQGRGTLHLHLLLWLKHAPSSDEMTELLKDATFRSRIVAFIQANFRAYLPGLESAEAVKRLPCQKDIAFNRPPKPNLADYDVQLQQLELGLARAEQVHTCKIRRCLIPDKNGRLICKRKAPFNCAPDDFVTETGKWGPKRLYAYINGWVPGILINARCNNDGKLLTNGGDTRNITFYVTSYAAKKQGKHFNLSAILADVTNSNSHYDVVRLLLFGLTRLLHCYDTSVLCITKHYIIVTSSLISAPQCCT
ncbi:hypothetical protein M378DRAFT_90614 [Amanita muscaria Koide BX008]|uniref:Uncharacterized protein n=1 Tax=Amanita muscaria (strain Koide BX008) TaxID=946122 RepID=A0A0C2SNS3_AMAMK|nr:hypothetical protein M378DRAFT_90614 [Amanita muscaria Koide BX008]